MKKDSILDQIESKRCHPKTNSDNCMLFEGIDEVELKESCSREESNCGYAKVTATRPVSQSLGWVDHISYSCNVFLADAKMRLAK